MLCMEYISTYLKKAFRGKEKIIIHLDIKKKTGLACYIFPWFWIMFYLMQRLFILSTITDGFSCLKFIINAAKGLY